MARAAPATGGDAPGRSGRADNQNTTAFPGDVDPLEGADEHSISKLNLCDRLPMKT
jgi:hypothetical protein